METYQAKFILQTTVRRSDSYKQAGIYQIISSINDKSYIGSSVNIVRRVFEAHLNDLRKGKHHSIFLQRHFNKYGESDLYFMELETMAKKKSETKAHFIQRLQEKEQYWMDRLNPEFNLRKITKDSHFITVTTDATRKKMSISSKKWRETEEGKEASKKASLRWQGDKNPLFDPIKRKQADLKRVGQKRSEIINQVIKKVKIEQWKNMSPEEKEIQLNKTILNPENREKFIEKLRISVSQYTLQGIFVNSFISINDASRQTNIHLGAIAGCLKNMQNKSGGFIWTHGEPPTKEQIRKANILSAYDIHKLKLQNKV